MTESLIAAFVATAFIALPLGFVFPPRLPARLRRRFSIIDRRSGRVVSRHWTFGAAAARHQPKELLWPGRYDLEKR